MVPKGYISPLKYGSYSFFGCEKLEFLGEGVIGENMKDCKTLAHMFDGAKIKHIPDDLLLYCENLIDVSYMFEACDIETIPKKLFHKCPKIKDMAHIFHRCDYLGEVPEGMLDKCIELENMECAFQACRRLKSVPTNLFKYCTKLKNVKYAFAGENALGGYDRTQPLLTSNVPPLWERSDLPYGGVLDIGNKKWYHGYAFGCVNAANYDDVPEGWK